MWRNNRTSTFRGTLRWFLTFSILYLLTNTVISLIMDRPLLGSLIGPAIGTTVVFLFVLWWRHWRKR